MNPFVSVILPVYNREQFVARAVESVFAQSYTHWELLVVDDGSSDGTRAILESYGSKLRLLSTGRKGAYGARNAALAEARGELIAFIDSDDRWLPRRLESQLPLFRPGVGLVFGNASLWDARGARPHWRRHTYFDLLKPGRGRVLEPLALQNFIPQSSVLVRRSCMDAAGPFATKVNVGCDHVKWIEIAMHHEVDFVPGVVFEYTQHGGNLSRDLSRSLEGRAVLLDDLMQTTKRDDHRQVLQRALFALRLNLALTDPWRALHHAREAFAGAASVPLGRRCRWFLAFVRDFLDRVVLRLMPPRAKRGAI